MVESVLFLGLKTPLEKIAIGASRIAGPPDLPVGVEWPRVSDGRRMPMVLQLALRDVAAFPAAQRFPRDGTLYFFAAQLSNAPSIDINDVPAAIVYAPAGAELVRAVMPPEASDEEYWDTVHVARPVDFAAHTSAREEDEPTEPHVLFPINKYSSAFGEVPPAGFVGLLEMKSDYNYGMNWGDAAWATWVIAEADLAEQRFDRATANVWIG